MGFLGKIAFFKTGERRKQDLGAIVSSYMFCLTIVSKKNINSVIDKFAKVKIVLHQHNMSFK